MSGHNITENDESPEPRESSPEFNELIDATKRFHQKQLDRELRTTGGPNSRVVSHKELGENDESGPFEPLELDVVRVEDIDDLLDGAGALRMDGFDDCIIGIGRQFNQQMIVYSMAKVLEKMMREDGMSYTEAVEFFEFNQAGAWAGKGTPFFLDWEVEHDE